MKRDQRLHGLTSEHHHGLVLARRILQGRLDAAAVRKRFDAELTPHFQIEEELLLPALDEVGAVALAARTRSDHAELRGLLAAAERGEPGRLAAFATLLERHIRFEERELFPAVETLLSEEQLGRVPDTRRS
jgi:iron-sulfur cluster repair protein YtfE (RIC family)